MTMERRATELLLLLLLLMTEMMRYHRALRGDSLAVLIRAANDS